MSSSRLPGKVLKPILGKPMIWHVINRVSKTIKKDKIVVATSEKQEDKPIVDFCNKYGVNYYQGNKENVLDRFYKTAIKYKGDPILRVTADCPLIDPDLINKLINLYLDGKYDHVGIATGAGATNLGNGKYPDGLDVECFSFQALENSWKNAVNRTDREHVTPYMWRNINNFKIGILKSEIDYSDFRWTVDTIEDFKLIEKIYESLFKKDHIFLMNEILDFFKKKSKIIKN